MSKDKIKVLDTRQQCREKLPIFFGSRDNVKRLQIQNLS